MSWISQIPKWLYVANKANEFKNYALEKSPYAYTGQWRLPYLNTETVFPTFKRRSMGGRGRAPKYSLERRIRRLENRRGEWYTHDLTDFGESIGTTAYRKYLTGIAQGDNDGNRTGMRIRIQTIHMKFQLDGHGSQYTPTHIRLVLVADNANYGAQPGWHDIFVDNGASNECTTPKVLAKRGRYTIFFDKVITLNPKDVTGRSQGLTFNYYKKINRWVNYKGATAAYSDAERGNIWFFAISNNNTYSPVLSYTCRIKYTEF